VEGNGRVGARHRKKGNNTVEAGHMELNEVGAQAGEGKVARRRGYRQGRGDAEARLSARVRRQVRGGAEVGARVSEGEGARSGQGVNQRRRRAGNWGKRGRKGERAAMHEGRVGN
jgi:hypothetical protein